MMILGEPQGILLASAVGALCVIGYIIMQKSRKRTQWKSVATVTKLFVHPIKSCHSRSVDNIECHKFGLVISDTKIGDRSFLIVNGDGSRATTFKYPNMIFIEAFPISNERMLLKAPGTEPCEFALPKYDAKAELSSYTVLGDECPGTDCGDGPAIWLQNYLNDSTLRLVFHNVQLPLNIRKKLMKFEDLDFYNKEPVYSVFQNFSPFNLVSDASLEELNTKHERKVTMENFRPNVVVTGCSAFDEDNWKHIKIGTAEFLFAKCCNRCPQTTIDRETGILNEDGHPLSTLKEFRLSKPEERKFYGKNPRFSVDFVIVKTGIINVGDSVYLSV